MIIAAVLKSWSMEELRNELLARFSPRDRIFFEDAEEAILGCYWITEEELDERLFAFYYYCRRLIERDQRQHLMSFFKDTREAYGSRSPATNEDDSE